MYKKLPRPNTLPDLLLTLIALSGEFPTAQVSRLPSGAVYNESVVKRLKREKLARTFYRDHLRGLRLISTAKHLLLARDPAKFQRYLTGSTDTNRLKSELSRRLRLHRMAEVLVTMYNADVGVLQEEKPSVFLPQPPSPDVRVEWPCYYSSRELKEMGPLTKKVCNSRATGVLLTPDRVFAVYNIGPYSQTTWEYKAEMRLKTFLQMDVCMRRLPQYINVTSQAIVFGESMGQLPALMAADGISPQNHFLLDGSYEHFYYLTNDQYGETVLQFLCDPGARGRLDAILKEGFRPRNPGWLMENDAFDEHGDPVLLGYLCDMPRIRRFQGGLDLHGRRGTLYCFDFQADALRRVCGENITIQGLDFEKVKTLLDADDG